MGDPGEGTDNRVVDKCPEPIGYQTGRRIGIEDLEEMPDAECGGLLAEFAVRFERGQVVVQTPAPFLRSRATTTCSGSTESSGITRYKAGSCPGVSAVGP